jgi:peptidoglycan/xylan/chitin deacetylase (PgdA/CDA1 family)
LEFTKTINALVAAGAPMPTMWRPPYGDVDGQDVLIANSLGLRLVMPWSVDNSVTDSGDWVSGTTAATIVKNVTQGWSGGVVIHDGSIIAGHDGIEADAPPTIAALPQIVQWMNAHHLGAMTSVPANATGGIHRPKWSKQQAGNTGGG